MFDLLGFWSAVTIMTLAMIWPVFFFGMWGLRGIVGHAIPDASVASKAKLWVLDSASRHSYYGFFGNRFKPNKSVAWIAIVLSVLMYMAVLLDADPKSGEPFFSELSIVEGIADFAVWLTPLFSWVGACLAGYAVAFFLVRYGYKASVFSQAVQSHMDNKDIHK